MESVVCGIVFALFERRADNEAEQGEAPRAWWVVLLTNDLGLGRLWCVVRRECVVGSGCGLMWVGT